MVEAALRQTREPGLGQIAHVEVGVQAETERHGGITAVVHRGGDLQGRGHRAQLHLQTEGEGIGLQRFVGAGEAEAHTALILEQLKLPGKIPGEAVLLEGMVDAIHRQHISGQVSADRKQHRNAAANAFARIGVTVLVEIQDLPPPARPTTHQTTPLGNDSQPITAAGMHEVPVGVGGRLLGEGHGHPPMRGGSFIHLASRSAFVGAAADLRLSSHCSNAAFT